MFKFVHKIIKVFHGVIFIVSHKSHELEIVKGNEEVYKEAVPILETIEQKAREG